MTVSSDLSRVQYTAPGGSSDYAVNFKLFAASDLVVLETVAGVDATKVLDTDYTVTLNPDGTGTVTGSFTAGATITIYRDLPLTQETEFEEGDELPAGSLNDLADRLVMMVQQIKTLVGRAIRLPISSTLAEIIFPVASAGKFLRWNDAGTGFENADAIDVGGVVGANETTAGIAREATQPEVDAGTAGHIFVSAAKLAVRLAAALAGQALPTGHFQGFTLANNGTDATHDIDVGAGKARNDADSFNLVTAATIVKQTDVAFAEYAAPGTASGGMDSTTALTGTPATVHVFMIGGAGKNTQPFFSTSISPTLPSGFTAKVYVHSLLWTGATMRPFLQRGRDEIMLVTPVQQSATAVGTSARSVTLMTPTGIALLALVGLCVVAAGASANHGLSALDVTDLDPSLAASNGGYPVSTTTASGTSAFSSGWVKTNTAAQIRARASASHASNTEYINALGWRVMR